MIAIPKQRYKIEFLFPLIILGLSIYDIVIQFLYLNNVSYLGAFVSIVGITGATFYFTINKHYIPFILAWSLAQLIVIDYTTTNSETNESIVNRILDLTQSFKIEVGFALSIGEKAVHIAVNILSIVYLGLTIILKVCARKDKAQQDTEANNQK